MPAPWQEADVEKSHRDFHTCNSREGGGGGPGEKTAAREGGRPRSGLQANHRLGDPQAPLKVTIHLKEGL